MILGIDVGGTHTDAVLIDRLSVCRKSKVPTDGNNLLASLLAVTNELVDESTLKRLERVANQLNVKIMENIIMWDLVEQFDNEMKRIKLSISQEMLKDLINL